MRRENDDCQFCDVPETPEEYARNYAEYCRKRNAYDDIVETTSTNGCGDEIMNSLAQRLSLRGASDRTMVNLGIKNPPKKITPSKEEARRRLGLDKDDTKLKRTGEIKDVWITEEKKEEALRRLGLVKDAKKEEALRRLGIRKD